MTFTVLSANSIGTGVRFSHAAAGDDMHLLRGIVLASTDGDGISVVSSATDTNTRIDGTVSAALAGFRSAAVDTRLVVGLTGVINSNTSSSGAFGVIFNQTGADLINQGEISAVEAIAVGLIGADSEVQNTGLITGVTGIQSYFGSAGNRIFNFGTIMGSGSFDGVIDPFEGKGILVQSTGAYVYNSLSGVIGSTAPTGSGLMAETAAGGLRVVNHGEIAALGVGIDLSGVYGGQALIRVANRGTLSGETQAYVGSINGDTLMNAGLILGDIAMGDGDDRFNTREGRFDGIFNAGAGNDTVSGNAARDEEFNGGGGIDALDFRGGPAVRVALDGSFENSGAAAGDTYISFENVMGTAAADRITGSTAANRLAGGGGVDTISGGNGADTLIGNRGADVMTGGLGNDVFLFNVLTDCGDKISDFTNLSGNNDILHINAAAFGGGLVAGAVTIAMFVARADNLAQDADDRFIFRTTDKTVWFDADGNGAAAAVMVADLQDTATFARGDILLI